MTPAEFTDARKRLGLSVYALARILNVNHLTVRSWEKARRTPNPIACRVLTWLESGELLLDEPSEAKK